MEDWQREYLERARRIALEQAKANASSGSEGQGGLTGAGWSKVDEDVFNAYWDSVGLNEALNYVLNNTSGPGGAAADFQSAFVVSDKDPAKERYQQEFGESGNLRMSVGPPVMYGADYTQWALDPSKIIDMGDGRFIYDESNINQDVVNQLRDADARSGLNITPAMGVGFVLTAGMLGNAFLGAEGLAGGVGGGGGLVGGATEATAAGVGSGTATGAGGLEVSEAMRNILTQGTAAGGSAASSAANAAIQQGVQTLGGIGGGGFLSNLSPLSQRIIASAVGQSASAIAASQRQEQAQDFARQQQDLNYQRRLEEEERMREERRVRGTPQQYTFNVTPRPRTGIIGGGMGG